MKASRKQTKNNLQLIQVRTFAYINKCRYRTQAHTNTHIFQQSTTLRNDSSFAINFLWNAKERQREEWERKNEWEVRRKRETQMIIIWNKCISTSCSLFLSRSLSKSSQISSANKLNIWNAGSLCVVVLCCSAILLSNWCSKHDDYNTFFNSSLYSCDKLWWWSWWWNAWFEIWSAFMWGMCVCVCVCAYSSYNCIWFNYEICNM